MVSISQWLERYSRSGFVFFNTGSNQKKVLTRWTEFQQRHPTKQEVDRWLQSSIQQYAIVCGEISNLVVFDVDTKNGADPTPFLNRGLYQVDTPSGGYHFYTPYDPVFRSTKHKKADGILKAVDVQTNGSLVFAPPSHFTNQKPYALVNDVPIIPLPDDLLTQVIAALEPEEESKDYTPFTPRKHAVEGGRPGDIFNALATWEDILLPLGWKKIGQPHGGTQYWRRPGKTDGISASTNWKGYGLFFPYTTHYSELIWKKGYTKFSLYAILRHKGDFAEAARALVMENYRLANNLK